MIEVLVKRKRIVAFFKKFGLIIKRVVTSSRNRATGEKSFSKSLACLFFLLVDCTSWSSKSHHILVLF